MPRDNTAPSRAQSTLLAAIDLYLDAGFHLFPCLRRKKHGAKGCMDREHLREELVEAAEAGLAIGAVVGDAHLVLDDDNPKHWGDMEALGRLLGDLGLNPELRPTVVSPTGSTHTYLARDPLASIKPKGHGYDRIDAQRGRMLVLIPGSPHPGGGHYAWGPAGPPASLRAEDLPDAGACEALAYICSARPAGGQGNFSAENLECALSVLDPCDPGDWGGDWWLAIAACHAAVCGDPAGMEVFLNWAQQGAYVGSEHRAENQKRWCSADPLGDVTEASLCRWVKAKDEAAFRDLPPGIAQSADPEVELGEAPRGPSRLRTYEQLKDRPPVAWNVEGLLQRGTIANCWGLPGSAKTLLISGVACCVASGTPWTDRPVERGLVVYVVLEDVAGFAARLDGCLAGASEEVRAEVKANLRWVEGLSWEELPGLAEDIRELEEETGLPLRLLVVDPILAAFGAKFSVNDEKDFRDRLDKLWAALEPFPEATGVSVTHCGWSGEHELGSIAQRALTMTSIRCDNEDGKVRVDVVRQKNGAELWGMDFDLATDGGLPKLLWSGRGATRAAGKRRGKGSDRAKVLSLIEAACVASSDGWSDNAEVRETFLDRQTGDRSKDTLGKAWRRAISALEADGEIEVLKGRIRAYRPQGSQRAAADDD